MNTINGRVYVNFESNLEPEEESLIKHLSTARLNIPHMSIALERIFPSRAFTNQMLDRMKRKQLDDMFGKDRHNLPGLLAKCDAVRKNGGTFVIEPSSDDFGIKTIHCQTKLMSDYANVYSDLRMADGTFKLTQYDFVFILWNGIDCLFKSHFTGISCNFSENSIAIRNGANHFYPNKKDSLKVKTGAFDNYFCPFQDNEVDLSDDEGLSFQLQTTGDLNMASVNVSDMEAIKSKMVSPAAKSNSRSNNNNNPEEEEEEITFISDQGAGFKEVAESEGWNHIYDRKHFANEIMKYWGGLEDPSKFRNDIYRILNTVDKSNLDELLTAALSEHRTEKAREFIQHISDLRGHLCFSHTGIHFSAGHVSDARSEGGMAAVKANGKIRKLLAQSTFDEGIERIFSVSRKRDIEARNELAELRREGKKFG